MHNNIGEDIDTRRETIVKWKTKMAVYTDDNIRICNRKVEYIHVPFSTIHDAYIYVIRIANTLRKSVTILSKDINLRNLNSLKFKPRFLNASLRFEKRKKKKIPTHVLRGYIPRFIHSGNERAKLPQRCSRMEGTGPQQTDQDQHRYESFQIKIKRMMRYF